MIYGRKMLLAAGLMAMTVVGCHSDKPHEYGEQRPDVDQLDPNDSGLQSKDVVAATNQLVSDLLADPRLNASKTQWTLAVDHVQDMTIDKSFAVNYDIFTESLRTDISQKAQGRITLIENMANFNDIRNREVGGTPDTYGQGSVAPAQAPGAINPDYILYGKAIDMPNRATNFYMLQFTIFNTRTREQVWSRSYTVKVAR